MEKEKLLNEGTFHLVYDGSKTGHPGMIYWKNDDYNLYLALTTNTSSGRHRTKLETTISNNVKFSYINNRPFLGKRKDFGSKELEDIKFSQDDYEVIVIIKKREPRLSKNINKKDKYKFQKLKKSP